MKIFRIAAVFCILLSASLSEAAPKYHIGLVQQVQHPSLDEIRTAIIDELKAKGFGPDVVAVDYQNGQNNPSSILTICQKFVGDRVDLILPIATAAAQGAAAAAADIPIVFAAVSDPVAAGLTADLSKPDRNITGVSDAIDAEKIISVAMQMTPGIKTFGIVYNAGEVNSVSAVRKAEKAIAARGLKCVEAIIANSSEVATAASSLVGKVDAYFLPNDNTIATAMPLLAQIAIDAKLPVYTAADSMVHDGGLATSGINYTQLGRQTADMVIRVLQGKKIADTPVEVLLKGDIIVNQATAKALGIDVSRYLKK